MYLFLLVVGSTFDSEESEQLLWDQVLEGSDPDGCGVEYWTASIPDEVLDMLSSFPISHFEYI